MPRAGGKWSQLAYEAKPCEFGAAVSSGFLQGSQVALFFLWTQDSVTAGVGLRQDMTGETGDF